MSKSEADRKAAEFRRLQAVRVAEAERVVREQQAAQARCTGCGNVDKNGSLDGGRWYCGSCRRWDV